MKKLLVLTFMLTFATSMAFGQNTANVNQQGSDHLANIDQSANTGQQMIGNTVDLDQQETIGSSEAWIDQTSGDNNVQLSQTGSNYADIDQNNGNVLRGYNDQTANQQQGFVATVNNGGENNFQNELKAEQNATHSLVGVDQLGFNNDADITQGGGQGFTAKLNQEGALNDADLDQTGGNATLDVEQYGTENTVNASQGIDFTSGSNTGLIDQHGQNNTATLNQAGTGNRAVIDQNGGQSIAQ